MTRFTCRTGFNPHPAGRPDATSGHGRGRDGGHVSILIRPEGRMQPTSRGTMITPRSGFNPHPAGRPDATLTKGAPKWPLSTSFNPHPAGRPDATRGNGPLSQSPEQVSILIRPEGRMQLASMSGSWRTSASFNPHPAGRPDATSWRWWACNRRGLFQSSSGRKAGCNIPNWPPTRLPNRFNPHPAGRPDATMMDQAEPMMPEMFQSSSGRKAGCNIAMAKYYFRAVPCFNPHPAGRPDATGRRHCPGADCSCFNPHPAGRPDATGHQGGGPCRTALVSILIRPEGRMQRLYLNFLSVLCEPPDTGLPVCFHRPDHFFPPATIQLRTRTSRLQWLQHWVRVRPPAVP